jgi:CDP-diacylglycerol--glycerol-3-phosphate 3-phosphatidyltransferase
MTPSNWLTLFRVLLVPVFMAIFFSDVPYGNYFAAGVFALAALTDTFDGHLARIRRETTKIGEILDPFADKLLVSAALISLVEAGKLSSWFAVLIISREFLVSALRTVAQSKNISVPPSRLGKTKTFFQVLAIMICVALGREQLNPRFYTGKIAWFFLITALVLTKCISIEIFTMVCCVV